MKKLSIILIIIFSYACRERVVKPYSTGMENKLLPTFNILLPDSTTFFNTGDLSTDKKIILFYYSANCQYCRAQMREILNKIEHFKNVQLCVLTWKDFSSMKQFISYFGLQKYPNIITGLDTGAVVAENYKVISVPFTAVFDRDKQLTTAYIGRLSGEALLALSHP